jgi:hypothetical protein
MKSGLWRWVIVFVFVVLVAPVLAPQLLAFPHRTQIAAHVVYSVKPFSPHLAEIVAEADDLVARSPSGSFREPNQPIFLTDGGWRWFWLAGTAQRAFAVTRPLNEAIIVNRSSPSSGKVLNGRVVGGQRSLSGVIAHEMTHGSIRAHFGVIADFRYPADLREGYCDYVAGSGSLTDEQAQALIKQGVNHPALPYWRGRKRVERELAKPGSTIEHLFGRWK